MAPSLRTRKLPETSVWKPMTLLIDGILHHLWYAPGTGPKEERVIKQLVLPLTLRERILAALHDSPYAGHYGIARTSAVACMRYFWKGQLDDIASWVKSCKHCSQKKGAKEKHRAPLCPLPLVGAFERWNIDCIGPLTTTRQGNQYICVSDRQFDKVACGRSHPRHTSFNNCTSHLWPHYRCLWNSWQSVVRPRDQLPFPHH